MSEEARELTGEEILAQNMAALDAGEDIPHENDQEYDYSDDDPDLDPQEEPQEEDDATDQPLKEPSHMSEDEWVASGKDPDDYMSQDEFDRVGNMREDNSLTRTKMAKKIVQTEALMKEMLANQNAMIQKAEERTRDETIAKLRKEQKDAIDYGETEKAVDLERKISEQEKPAEKPTAEPQLQPSVQTFYENNDDWYNVDPGATGLLNVELKRAQRQGLDFDDAIGPAMDKVKGQFSYLFPDAPQKAQKPQRPRAVSERSRARPSAAPKKKTFNDLPPETRIIAKKAAKVSGLSESEYMEQMA